MSEYLHEEEALGKAYDARILQRLWHFVAPYRWQVVATLLLVVPIFALEVAPAWIIKNALDRATGIVTEGAAALPAELLAPPGWAHPFAWFGALYLVAVLAGAGFQFVNMVLMATTGQSAMRDLRRRVFDHILQLDLSFFDRYPVGRLVTRSTNDVENVAEMFRPLEGLFLGCESRIRARRLVHPPACGLNVESNEVGPVRGPSGRAEHLPEHPDDPRAS